MKRLSRALAIAIELGGLRVQQQRKRIIRSMTARDIGMLPGGRGIAMADREQSLCDRVSAPRAPSLVPVAPDTSRHAPERQQYRPGQNRQDNNDADQQHEYRQRGMSLPTA